MIHRPGNKAVKLIVLVALILVIVFAVVNNAKAPSEGEISDEADMMEENGNLPPPAAPTAECGAKNSVCETSTDCCGNLGLECQDVRTSDGGFGKRCLPVEVQVCRSDCDGTTWGEPRNCKAMVAPDTMAECESFVGTGCKESVHPDRNTRECWDT